MTIQELKQQVEREFGFTPDTLNAAIKINPNMIVNVKLKAGRNGDRRVEVKVIDVMKVAESDQSTIKEIWIK